MKKSSVVIFLLLLFLVFTLKAHAQFALDPSLGTAITVDMGDEKAQDGDIISTKSGGGYIKSKISYDPFIFGVVSLQPAILLYDKSVTNGVPVITSGKAYVRVSTDGGEINVGDRITSSDTPGVGIKAEQNGYIIGTAEEEYKAADRKAVGNILVAIDPRFAQINSNLAATLFTFPRLSFAEALRSPSTAMRYFLAAFVAAASLFLGVRFFSRVTTKGLEALGRNPLARRSIMVGIVINSALVIGVMVFGLAVSYLILAF